MGRSWATVMKFYRCFTVVLVTCRTTRDSEVFKNFRSNGTRFTVMLASEVSKQSLSIVQNLWTVNFTKRAYVDDVSSVIGQILDAPGCGVVGHERSVWGKGLVSRH